MLLTRHSLIAMSLGVVLVAPGHGQVHGQASAEQPDSQLPAEPNVPSQSPAEEQESSDELFLGPEPPSEATDGQTEIPVLPETPEEPAEEETIETETEEPVETEPVESGKGTSPATTNPLQQLNPDPDPLRLPPEAESKIDVVQPITLQQALELAQRNNLDVRVAELQLQQSQAALKQAKAANLPTLSAQGNLFRTDSSQFDLNPRPINLDIGAQNEVIARTLQRLQTQQALSLQNLSTDIANLQIRLQQGPDQQQQLVFDQQLQDLQLQASTTATLPLVPSFTPFSPLNSFASSGQGATDGAVSTTANGTLALTYNVFTSGSRSSLIRAARAQVRISELALQVQLEQLRLDVANDYYNLQEASALVTVTRSAVESATKSVIDAKALESAGLGTFFDVLQAEVRLADAQQNLTEAEALERIAQRQLAQRLNVQDAKDVLAADPIQAAGRWSLSLSQSIRLSLQNRPELAQILQQRRIAKQQRRVALAAIRPQVQAFANLEVVEQLDDDVSGAFGYSVGAQVTWNFFDGGAARAQASQEEENLAIAEVQFADTKNALRFEVEQAYSNLQANLENISTASDTVEQAEESLRLARLRFQAGIGTQLDITTAEADLTQAQGNRLSAILDYNRALALIQRATSYQQPLEPNF